MGYSYPLLNSSGHSKIERFLKNNKKSQGGKIEEIINNSVILFDGYRRKCSKHFPAGDQGN